MPNEVNTANLRIHLFSERWTINTSFFPCNKVLPKIVGKEKPNIFKSMFPFNEQQNGDGFQSNDLPAWEQDASHKSDACERASPKDPSVSRAIRIVLSASNILWNNKRWFPPKSKKQPAQGDVAAARPYRGEGCSVALAHLPHLRRRRRRPENPEAATAVLAPRAQRRGISRLVRGCRPIVFITVVEEAHHSPPNLRTMPRQVQRYTCCASRDANARWSTHQPYIYAKLMDPTNLTYK